MELFLIKIAKYVKKQIKLTDNHDLCLTEGCLHMLKFALEVT